MEYWKGIHAFQYSIIPSFQIKILIIRVIIYKKPQYITSELKKIQLPGTRSK